MNCPNCNIESQRLTCPNPKCGRTGLPSEALLCPDCGSKLRTAFANFTETVNGVSFEMIAVEGGTFLIGSPEYESERYDNEKQHQVTLSKYHIGKTVVTQALWKAVMGKNLSYFKGDNLPVEQVSWNDCQQFIQQLNQLTNKKYSLPTEAQWEFVARGGTCRAFIPSF